MGESAGDTLRARLVATALAWWDRYGVAPQITSTLSELDAARLVGMSEPEYARDCATRTAVTKGYDFRHEGIRYQVKANRPSGKPGSTATLVNGPRNFDWDRLIWVLYDREYQLVEAWLWEVDAYRARLAPLERIGPPDMRLGHRLFPQSGPAIAPLPQKSASPRPEEVTTVGRKSTQRERMRELYERCGLDGDRTVAAYADAERRGEVE